MLDIIVWHNIIYVLNIQYSLICTYNYNSPFSILYFFIITVRRRAILDEVVLPCFTQVIASNFNKTQLLLSITIYKGCLQCWFA